MTVELQSAGLAGPPVLDRVSKWTELSQSPAQTPELGAACPRQRYFSRETNGLDKEWRGKIYLNPSFEQPLIAQFVAKLIAEVEERHVTEAIVLTNATTDTRWFHSLLSVADAICFTRGRIAFLDVGAAREAPVTEPAFSTSVPASSASVLRLGAWVTPSDVRKVS